jgi:F-type H+-transporting ATPase subunit c
MLKKAVFLVVTGLVSSLAFFVTAMAAEAGGATGAEGGEARMWIVISAGFGMAIATTAGAMSQSKGLTAALDGIARNPSAAGQMVTPMIIGLALIESLVIYTLIICFLIVGKF